MKKSKVRTKIAESSAVKSFFQSIGRIPNLESLRGRAVRLACRAHNPEVTGSNPVLVTCSEPFCSLIIIRFEVLLESNLR